MCVQVFQWIENALVECCTLYLCTPVSIDVCTGVEVDRAWHTTCTYLYVLMCIQVLKLIDNAHVLACAPSNAAADLLAERLLEHLPSSSNLLRMCAYSRDWISVPSSIKVAIHQTAFC